MGKGSRKRRNKTKTRNKAANNKNETAKPSASNTIEVNTDGKNVSDCSQRCICRTHAAAIFPDEISNSERRKESTEDSEISEAFLHIGKSILIREETLEAFLGVGDYILYKCSVEMNFEIVTKNISIVLHKQHRYLYEYLKIKSPKLVKKMEECVRLQIEKYQLQQLSSTSSKSNQVLKAGELKETPFTADNPMMTSLCDNNITKAHAHLVKDEENKFRTDGNGNTIDNVQKSKCSAQKRTKYEAVKDVVLSASYIQIINDILRNMYADALMEIIDENRNSVYDSEIKKIINEIKYEFHEETYFNQRMKALTTFLSAYIDKNKENNKISESLLKSAKEKQDFSFTQNEVIFEKTTDKLKMINASTEQADRTNDIIMKLQKVDIAKEEKKDSDSSTDNFVTPDEFPEKANKDRKKEDKDKDNADVSNASMYDSDMTEKAETSDEPGEIVTDLENNTIIQFEFEAGGKKHIIADSRETLKEDQTLSFNYKDGVKVSFFGNHVSISTPNSEFDIFIRSSNSVSLTDKTTQTDSS